MLVIEHDPGYGSERYIYIFILFSIFILNMNFYFPFFSRKLIRLYFLSVQIICELCIDRGLLCGLSLIIDVPAVLGSPREFIAVRII